MNETLQGSETARKIAHHAEMTSFRRLSGGASALPFGTIPGRGKRENSWVRYWYEMGTITIPTVIGRNMTPQRRNGILCCAPCQTILRDKTVDRTCVMKTTGNTSRKKLRALLLGNTLSESATRSILNDAVSQRDPNGSSLAYRFEHEHLFFCVNLKDSSAMEKLTGWA